MSSTVVVTGANGDIGRAVVDLALEQGCRVVATVRDSAQFGNFPAHDALTVLAMDVSSKSSVQAAFDDFDKRFDGERPDAIIHCAAAITSATIEDLDPEVLEHILRTNTIGSLNIMQAAIPRLRGSGKNLVLCSSFWGRFSGPMVGAYASSKWALEGLVDAARRETRGMGFSMTLANIGAVRGTRMLVDHLANIKQLLGADKRGLYDKVYQSQLQQLQQADPAFSDLDKVAAKLLRIADRNKLAPRYTVGKDAAIVCSLIRLLPARLIDKAY